MKIDMSLKSELYAGCEIEEVAGRLNLTTPIPEARDIVGRNAAAIMDNSSPEDRKECTLTGPMAVWAYLVKFIDVERLDEAYGVLQEGETISFAEAAETLNMDSGILR